MNSKLLTTACLGLSLAVWAGCTQAPPTTLIVTSGSGSGAGNGSGAGDEGGSGGAGAGSPTTSSSGTGVQSGAAKAYFENTVYGELSGTCGPCHAPPTSNGAPQWLGANASSSYQIATNYAGFLAAPDNSILVSRGSIAHTGPAMTPTELTHVKHWLDLEVEERHLTDPGGGSGGGSNTPVTLEEALSGYGQCMDFDLWKTPSQGTGLDHLPDAQTDEHVQCYACHGNGVGGNYLSHDAQMTFNKNQMYPFVLRQVTGTVDEQGNFKKLVASKRWIDKGSEDCDPNYQDCHPKFTLSQDLQDGINSFVSDTITKYEMGTCGTP